MTMNEYAFLVSSRNEDPWLSFQVLLTFYFRDLRTSIKISFAPTKKYSGSLIQKTIRKDSQS